MNFIVFDLEASCWEQKKGRKNETIEIGAVLVNEQQEVVSEFVQFIQPVVHPTLSDFCTQLTSIQQADVDGAPHFPEAVMRFREWFKETEGPYVLCSWGFYDRNQLQSDCEIHGMDNEWVHSHISLKHQYAKFMGLRRGIGMKGALAKEGFTLDGTHHRGIDDARNIAKIFIRHFERWEMPSEV